MARVSSILKSWMSPTKTEEAGATDLCPCCGGSGYIYSPRTTAKDVAVTILCSVLLLAIAIPAAWATEQWMERESQKIVHHMMMWHEPIESWNQ